jgi:hypothetical protein
MAKLTQEDIDNYGNLKAAFEKLDISSEGQNLKPVLRQFREQIIKISQTPNNTEELHQKIERIERYRDFSDDLGSPIEFKGNSEEESRKLKQQFSDAIENLKRSLKVLEDEEIDLTDEIETFQLDNLFIKFILQVENNPPPNPSAKKSTEDLINDIDPNLNESQIEYLTNTWETAISAFVEDARQEADTNGMVTPLEPTTFASFFRIHKELEILYSRLADSETVQLA